MAFPQIPNGVAWRAALLLLALHTGARVDVAAAQPQTAEALFSDANTHWDAGRYTEAYPLYLKAATDSKHAGAQFRIGLFYFHGRGGVAEVLVEEVRWYTLASDQGYAAAQSDLGWAYLKALGVGKDEARALRLFVLAAAQGERNGQVHLGYMHSRGLGGLVANKTEARRWYTMAANQGDAADAGA